MDSNLSVDVLVGKLAKKLSQYLADRGIDSPEFIGIYTGGVWVAKALQQEMASTGSLGTLNISYYRDDFTKLGLHPEVKPSDIPFEINGKHIVLVDDVIHTGRTIRAALNEIFDYGRPESITLVSLVERPGHELPIRADVVGTTLNLSADEHVKLSGPSPLTLTINRGTP